MRGRKCADEKALRIEQRLSGFPESIRQAGDGRFRSLGALRVAAHSIDDDQQRARLRTDDRNPVLILEPMPDQARFRKFKLHTLPRLSQQHILDFRSPDFRNVSWSFVLIHSMTGFAAAESSVGSYRLSWEIRSVNHRYLDLGFRLPEDFRSLEPRLRKLAAAAINRGKVDCTLRVNRIGSSQADSEINRERLLELRRLESEILEHWQGAGRLGVNEILRWPGVLGDDADRTKAMLEPALAGFGEALASLSAAREREGRRLGEMIVERLDAIESLMVTVDEQLRAAAPRYRDKLLERLAKLDVEAEPERLEQELAFIAQRTDVAEEADRLRAHIAELRDVLKHADPIGRRLDFLIQELNREANTLASKVQDDELARRAVDLKVLIEQMREQAQNIE